MLSYSQAGPGRKAKQGQEEISRNHVPTFFLGSVSVAILTLNMSKFVYNLPIYITCMYGHALDYKAIALCKATVAVVFYPP